MNIIESGKFTMLASLGLLVDRPQYPSIKRRPLLNELASTPSREPLNREEDILVKFKSIMEKRGITAIPKDKRPYWMKDVPYDPIEVFGTSIQFMDQHNAYLPKTTLPPSKDIEAFINAVLKEPTTVTIDRQFELLLDITNNDIIGAANIGMLANRLMSRFSDQRAYPRFNIDGMEIIYKETTDEQIESIMRKWYAKIARFESYNDVNGRNDGSGDQYYFWTHFLAACFYRSDTAFGLLFQKTFQYGNGLMILAKDYFARRGGTVSEHYEASLLGRHVGLAISSPDFL